MTPVDALLVDDPMWLVVSKAVFLLVFLLGWTVFNIWFEGRLIAKMQNRRGPVMAGPFGMAQGLADGIKLLFKEDLRPAKTDRVVFTLAPFLVAVSALTVWAVLPLGGQVSILGEETALQLADFPSSVLVVLALGTVGIFGIALGGWASSGTYSLLGSMRATAQMISYQVAMGLSMVAVFLYSGSMSASGIVEAQQTPIHIAQLNLPLPGWYALLLVPSFITFLISMFGETNRLPFDLPECESELVGGYLTDYSGVRYGMFYLAEYVNTITASAVATTLFLGGHRAPWPINSLFGGALDQGWAGPLWFLLKTQLLFFLFVWVRASLPRLRYDQFMSLGWKILIPANLVWLFALTVVQGLRAGDSTHLVATASVITAVAVLCVLVVMVQDRKADQAELDALAASAEPFDPFAGGYPVPPRPGEQLPELAGLVPATLTVTALSDRYPGREEDAL